MSADYDNDPMGVNGYMSTSGFPENDYNEPDDSEDVYYDTYAELEEVVKRKVAWAKRYRREQEERERLVSEEVLVGD